MRKVSEFLAKREDTPITYIDILETVMPGLTNSKVEGEKSFFGRFKSPLTKEWHLL